MCYKGSRPYQSEFAKRQIDVMRWWVGLKMTPLTLYRNYVSAFSHSGNHLLPLIYHLSWWVVVCLGQIYNVTLTFCVVTWVWTALLILTTILNIEIWYKFLKNWEDSVLKFFFNIDSISSINCIYIAMSHNHLKK